MSFRDKVLTKLAVELRDIPGSEYYGRTGGMDIDWPEIKKSSYKIIVIDDGKEKVATSCCTHDAVSFEVIN